MDYWTAGALLAWQIEAGADEAMLDAPVNRYDLDIAAAKPAKNVAPPQPEPEAEGLPRAATADDLLAAAVDEARRAAQAAGSLEALADAIGQFPHCDLKLGARKTVFSDGHPGARLMIVGEAPGRDEDLRGKPFVGKAGQLLDRMLAAIGHDRQQADTSSGVYITNVLPWRPPGNRRPEATEIAMMLPFLERHIELAAPDVIVLMGNTPCQALLGRTGITRLRGGWAEAMGRPTLPTFHPAYLLRSPIAKREAWADLLSLKARLDEPVRS